jgi:exosome complex component RRP46
MPPILMMSASNGENSGSRGTSFESESNIYSSNELHIVVYNKVLHTHPSVQLPQHREKVANKPTMVPQITTSTLNRADGSATYTDSLFAVLAAVNGPVEVSRRDELPEEATIEVNIRPGSGVGGPRERWLETVLHSLLRSIVLVHLHPRTLVQVTLQVVREPGIKFTKGRGEVAILPTLANAAFLALVDGGLPLETTMNAALVAVNKSGAIVAGPDAKDLETCESVHAMAFGAQGGMLLDESTGRFDLSVWEAVADKALERCTAAFASEGEDEAMANGDVEQEPWLRQALEERVRDANAWREST